jgi:hypothetical protein
LHKCGEITLGRLYIFGNENGPMIWGGNYWELELPLADVPIPENIKNFKSITIRFVFTITFDLNIGILNYNSAISTNPSLLFCKNFSEIPC